MGKIVVDNYVIAAWLGGFLVGWFVVLHFIIFGKGAGSSTGYACAINKVGKNIMGMGNLDPLKLFFILGLPIGGLAHALFVQHSFNISFDMGMYEAILPENNIFKVLVLIFGGTLLGFGARLAGGCTTGHVLAGGAVLNKASLLAGVIFFASATITAQLLFRIFA